MDIPKELTTELNKNEKALSTFNKLPPSHKKEYIKYVMEAKKDETKKKRAGKVTEMLINKKVRYN